MNKLLIIYGSQTGTTEKFCNILSLFAKARGFPVQVFNAADYLSRFSSLEIARSNLEKSSRVIYLTSTYGNGEFPTNMQSFWDLLNQKPLPDLKNQKYAVFGFGQKSTGENFCVAARKLDKKLAELGASQILQAAYADQDAGFEVTFIPWMRSLWAKLGPESSTASISTSYQVSSIGTGTAELPTRTGCNVGTVLKNQKLTGEEKDVHLLTVLLQSGTTYDIHDHVKVFPENSDHLVQRCAILLGQDLNALLEIKKVDDNAPELPQKMKVGDLLKYYIDIAAPPTRFLLEVLASVAKDPNEKHELENLAEDMNANNKYQDLCTGVFGSWSIVDVLEQFKSVKFDSFGQFLSLVPQIQPRLYSVSSSPLVNKNAVDLLIGLDEHKAKDGKLCKGLCSSFLCSAVKGQTFNFSIEKGIVNLAPDSSAPIVGIALGTGIGPFRALLQHRKALSIKAPMILYYGIRNFNKDFLFRSELEEFEDLGYVILIISCSHDQKEFVTPADKIRENGLAVTKYLTEKNAVYIYCGLGGVVPQVMEYGLIDAFTRQTSMGEIEAMEKISKLKSEKRWFVEAYSKDLDSENHLKSLNISRLDSNSTAAIYQNSKMFCFQCEQTFQGSGCSTVGVCGKTPEVSALQDLLIDSLKRLSWFAHRVIKLDEEREYSMSEIQRFTIFAAFSTLTNVNFDSNRFPNFIEDCKRHQETLEKMYKELCIKKNVAQEKCNLINVFTSKEQMADMEDFFQKAKTVGVLSRFALARNDALVGLQEMLVYGLKGISAYADHALLLGFEDQRIYDFIFEAFSFLTSKDSKVVDNCLGMLMKAGEINLITMDLLHKANTNLGGAQSPYTVPVKPSPGKCILVSGHDMKYLVELLKQTEGTNINVYTHGEMLPAHGYPNLRKFKNLKGHFGIAWQRQSVEFPYFPGAIVMTTNCLTRPQKEYNDRLFTCGAVGWDGIPHLKGFDFSPVIEKAKQCPGFNEGDSEYNYPIGPFSQKVEEFTVGFGHEVVISVADKVIEGVKNGDISRFFVIGGCDGYEGERSYFTNLAQSLPDSAVVLTAGCGKYRINGLKYKTIGDTGIPRLLDLGQCNDSFSAIQIALALSKAFNCGVNDLPLSICLSWFEQKAIAVLLTLLYLGIQNIKVGPRLPAFLKPSVVTVLNEKFGLKVTTTAQADLLEMYGGNIPGNGSKICV